ncbi:MAG: hypothetical protein ACREAB_05940, partial [Blastocatellia bacterium]
QRFPVERIRSMSAIAENETKTVATITVAELEAIIRRVAREEMRQHSDWIVREMIEFWRNEGPPDLEGDELLARDALELIEKYKNDHSGFITLEELEAELAAEASAEAKAKADEISRGNLAGGA